MRAKTVNEVIQEPFTNNTRNMPIRGTYPLSRIQYEDVDKPEFDDCKISLRCPSCNKLTPKKDLFDGVCKKCAKGKLFKKASE